jgi:hypothetical protein
MSIKEYKQRILNQSLTQRHELLVKNCNQTMIDVYAKIATLELDVQSLARTINTIESWIRFTDERLLKLENNQQPLQVHGCKCNGK